MGLKQSALSVGLNKYLDSLSSITRTAMKSRISHLLPTALSTRVRARFSLDQSQDAVSLYISNPSLGKCIIMPDPLYQLPLQQSPSSSAPPSPLLSEAHQQPQSWAQHHTGIEATQHDDASLTNPDGDGVGDDGLAEAPLHATDAEPNDLQQMLLGLGLGPGAGGAEPDSETGGSVEDGMKTLEQMLGQLPNSQRSAAQARISTDDNPGERLNQMLGLQ
eukprot:c12533_g1_i1.p2 GENE.c12533_g1_i1~~c12533_g1_i1.p2  ORF type:complete len:219 (+),score=49.35 c12533_g1_i1:665-1321(+)